MESCEILKKHKVITQYKPRDYIQLIIGWDHQKDLGRNGYTWTPTLLIERKFLGINAVILQQAFFGKGPETLDTVDLHIPIHKLFSMVDSPMFEPIADKALYSSEIYPCK